MKLVLPTSDSGRLVSTVGNGLPSFPGIRVKTSAANVGPKANMTPAAISNRLNMMQDLIADVSAKSEMEGTPVK